MSAQSNQSCHSIASERRVNPSSYDCVSADFTASRYR